VECPIEGGWKGVASGGTGQKWWENLKLRDNIEEPRIDNVIILKLIVETTI
jgi:hypothetical protein